MDAASVTGWTSRHRPKADRRRTATNSSGEPGTRNPSAPPQGLCRRIGRTVTWYVFESRWEAVWTASHGRSRPLLVMGQVKQGTCPERVVVTDPWKDGGGWSRLRPSLMCSVPRKVQSQGRSRHRGRRHPGNAIATALPTLVGLTDRLADARRHRRVPLRPHIPHPVSVLDADRTAGTGVDPRPIGELAHRPRLGLASVASRHATFYQSTNDGWRRTSPITGSQRPT